MAINSAITQLQSDSINCFLTITTQSLRRTENRSFVIANMTTSTNHIVKIDFFQILNKDKNNSFNIVI